MYNEIKEDVPFHPYGPPDYGMTIYIYDSFFDQFVLDRKNRIIITSNKHGLIVYDHQEGTFRKFPFVLTQKQQGSVVILQ